MVTEFSPVFLTADEVQLLKKRIAGEKWAADIALKALFGPAEQDAGRAIVIPAPFHAEDAYFNDPLTGAPLEFDPKVRGPHRTSDGRELRSAEMDWAWDAICHDQNANAMRRCALAGLLKNDARLLGHARHLLLEYGRRYAAYPPRGRQSATWGKLFYQALNESVWAISALWTAECLWHADALPPEELAALRDDLFFPLVDLVWGEWYFIHNIRMWHNAAIGCIGLAFGDRTMVRHAVFGDKGFRQQLVDGYRWKDGFSCEGTVGYHGYGMSAMLFLAEAMQRNGFDPYHDPHLRRAVLAPYAVAQPNGAPPALGDMYFSRSLPTRLYAVALGRYPSDPAVRAAASLAFSQWSDAGCAADYEAAAWNNTTAYYGRSEVDWILHGPPPGADVTQPPAASVVFPDTGLGIARPGTGSSGSYLLLKAFAHTGNHDHFDRLSIVWWENNTCWFDDPGTCYYSHPNHEGWFKHTIAHNTACLDGKRQERCSARITKASETEIEAETRPYPATNPRAVFSRRLERVPGGWRDTFRISGAKHQVLLFFHPRGLWVNPPPHAEPASLDVEGVAAGLPTNLRSIDLSRIERPLVFKQGKSTMHFEVIDSPRDTVLFLGEAPGDPQNQKKLSPFLALSSASAETSFTCLYRIADAEEG